MNTSIYQVAMYEVIQRIRKACPTYSFYDIYEQDDCHPNAVLDDVFAFTEELHLHFPSIDANTYVMVVCGAMMQCFVSDLAYVSDLDDAYLQKLTSPFADEQTKEYFGQIFYAIDAMNMVCQYNDYREMDNWPICFPLERIVRGAEMDEYRGHVLKAIELCPNYPYAYCLLTVFHFNSFVGMSVNFHHEGKSYAKAVLQSHKYMGDPLFRFVMYGNFGYEVGLILQEFDTNELIVHESVECFTKERGYTAEEVSGMQMEKGFFVIEGKRYPAGIPFFCYFTVEEFEDLIAEAMDNPAESENGEKVFHQYAIYNGLLHLMPIYDVYARPEETLMKTIQDDALFRVTSRLLDVSANELAERERLHKELEKTNEHLNRHMALNQELVRSLSHSSANYLNSEKLAHTGMQLHRAEIGSPSVEELHSEGLSLLFQSEQEMFLARQLNSLVWRCSAKVEDLMRQIREGLVFEDGLGILSPIEFAMKTVMSRILFRVDDRRGEFIRNKMPKAEEMEEIRVAFMKEILAVDVKEGEVLGWWNRYVAPFEVTFSDVWKNLHILKDKAFHDLVVEITSEQLLNALSHGEIEAGIQLELGQENNRFGRPVWAYISCVNKKGTAYKGGRSVGVSTLKETLLLLSTDSRGIDVMEDDGMYESKAWLLKNFLEPMGGEV